MAPELVPVTYAEAADFTEEEEEEDDAQSKMEFFAEDNGKVAQVETGVESAWSDPHRLRLKYDSPHSRISAFKYCNPNFLERCGYSSVHAGNPLIGNSAYLLSFEF